jgi:hypothetical protein
MLKLNHKHPTESRPMPLKSLLTALNEEFMLPVVLSLDCGQIQKQITRFSAVFFEPMPGGLLSQPADGIGAWHDSSK